jgi:hypothetical protein
MDVKSAFLNGELEEVMYMVQPKGYEDKEHKDYVYKFKKTIYGLKQAQKVWNRKIHNVFLHFSF